MNLYRRKPSPFWQASTTIGGKNHRWSTKCTNKGEAATQAAEHIKTLSSEGRRGKPRITLHAACVAYLKTMGHSNDHRNLKTRVNKLFGLEGWGHIHHLSKDLWIDELTTAHVTRLREQRLAEGLKPNSVNLEIRVLQRVYNLCKKEWLYAVEPDVMFKVLKTRFKTRYLSGPEEQRVLNLLSSTDTRPTDLFMFLIDCGCRLGEALSLQWHDVDMERGMITLFRSKTQSHTTVGITDRVRAMLGVRQQSISGELVFPHMDRPIKAVRAAINAVCNTDQQTIERHGRATIHSLRDTFASRLVQDGFSLYNTSQLLGHQSTVMTAKYAHVAGERNAREAAELINKRNAVPNKSKRASVGDGAAQRPRPTLSLVR